MKILKGDWKRANQFCRKMTRKTKYYKTCKIKTVENNVKEKHFNKSEDKVPPHFQWSEQKVIVVSAPKLTR